MSSIYACQISFKSDFVWKSYGSFKFDFWSISALSVFENFYLENHRRYVIKVEAKMFRIMSSTCLPNFMQIALHLKEFWLLSLIFCQISAFSVFNFFYFEHFERYIIKVRSKTVQDDEFYMPA